MAFPASPVWIGSRELSKSREGGRARATFSMILRKVSPTATGRAVPFFFLSGKRRAEHRCVTTIGCKSPLKAETTNWSRARSSRELSSSPPRRSSARCPGRRPEGPPADAAAKEHAIERTRFWRSSTETPKAVSTEARHERMRGGWIGGGVPDGWSDLSCSMTAGSLASSMPSEVKCFRAFFLYGKKYARLASGSRMEFKLVNRCFRQHLFSGQVPVYVYCLIEISWLLL